MPGEPDLARVLVPQRVLILDSKTKKDALQALADCLSSAAEVKNRDDLVQAIFYREELMSTGIGMGIAVPHVRLASVTGPVMSAGICHTPITDYESLDGVSIRLIFMIAAGQHQHAEYLRLLSSLSLKFKDEKLRDALIAAPDTQSFYNVLVRRED
ncbi:MAG: PTS sugar transporter subunit IIA [Sedimentisphaerales bacterium]|nr:PTS sugar transporter subunit IIA [Sedimentisphaerales bacterium]